MATECAKLLANKANAIPTVRLAGECRVSSRDAKPFGSFGKYNVSVGVVKRLNVDKRKT
jgi:hypothetical protein